MAIGFRSWNRPTDKDVSRALDVLSGAERSVLQRRFELASQGATNDNILPIRPSNERFIERRALRKLRSASMQATLVPQYGARPNLPQSSGWLKRNKSLRDWSVSSPRREEAWLGGSGADLWDEA